MLRIGGLATGIDTQDLIAKLMAIERRPILLIKENQGRLESKKTTWSTINSSLTELRRAVSALTSTLTFNETTAVSSHPAVLTATASAGADAGSYEIAVIDIARAHKVASDRQTTSVEALGVSGTFEVNGTAIEVDADMSLLDVRDHINNADAGVKATVVDNRLVITRAATGNENITFVDDPVTQPLTELGILSGDGSISNELVAPSSAHLTVDGLSIVRDSNTISDVIMGVTLNVHRVSDEVATLDIAADVDTISGKVTTFVERYNSTLSLMSAESGKEGKLRGDGLINMLRQQLRFICGAVVSELDSYTSLLDIGITSSLSGELTFDQSLFKERLSADPQGVQRLFAEQTIGVAVRMDSFINSAISTSGLISDRTSSLQARIDDMSDRMTAIENRLRMREENLVRRFTELEVALSTLQNQSAWLGMQMTQWTNTKR